MQSAEIELKFPIANVAQLQERLPGLGFVLETARTFEENTLYDTPGRTLREARHLLRVRRYGDIWTLTHKRRPEDPSQGSRQTDPIRYKVRIETETRVEDGAALAAILEQLGYTPVFRYEKFRTEWRHGGTESNAAEPSNPLLEPLPDAAPGAGTVVRPASRHLVIDETAIGNYAELEGPPEWIDQTITHLAVDPASCMTESYGRLFLAWKQKTGSACENLTFAEVEAAAPMALSPG